jgi:ABC-type phosphate transport system substrate-binding protein
MKARLLRRMGWLGCLVAACVAMGLATGASVASASESEPCALITGSGSSLQNLAQKEVWSPAWESTGFKVLAEKTLKCSATQKVLYTATSSGKGLAEWGSGGTLEPSEAGNKENKLDEFVGTDVGPEPAQMTNMATASGSEVVTFPIAQSAVTVDVSLPTGCTPSSTTGILVKNGALSKTWLTDGETFSSLVGGVTLSGTSCSDKPLLEARESASGTTAAFKRYLGDLELSSWDKCVLTAVESESASCWGSAKPLEAGNSTGGELANKVLTTLGTIGYADLADARAKSFPAPGTAIEHTSGGSKFLSFIALVPNHGTSEGAPQNPEIQSGTLVGGANCGSATYTTFPEVAPEENWSTVKQENATSGTAGVYPLCTLTYDVAWHKYSVVEWGTKEKYSEAQFHTAFNYLRWVVTEGQEGTAGEKLASAHFRVLPGALITKDKTGMTMNNIFFTAEGN